MSGHSILTKEVQKKKKKYSEMKMSKFTAN